MNFFFFVATVSFWPVVTNFLYSYMGHFKYVVCNSSYLMKIPVSALCETGSFYLDMSVLV